ncbi:D-alanine--D-alanine ligase [Cutibacterium sp. WCA-380-WT-3A]|uniref:D-alanine--D-alanine ligase n=1 Tax=Cutibacterium porci TaxID=2605781 RepID=A0A7K0J412_9ACTN|nr:D-alanine--D-alanine ligase [Cutibacterium porci]MSS44667.1 D-alanine--D-alanine ligase [Cutibacterium porci]
MLQPVVVLAGGLSHQRDISLKSGRTVAQALRQVGHEVVEADIDSSLIETLRANDGAVVFPMLHGGLGENGALLEVLQLMSIPYVGSGPATCRVSFDKSIASRTVAAAGVATPQQVALPHDIFRELGARTVIRSIGERFGLPIIVKPARGGSSLGITKVDDIDDLPQAIANAYAYDNMVVVEKFVSGTELAIGMITTSEGTHVLPAVEIRPIGGVYDYSAMYTGGETRLTAPADISNEAAHAATEMAQIVQKELDFSGISRVDAIIDESGLPVFLEAGTAPGMTATSLIPVAMKAAGLDIGEVCSRLVDDVARNHG